MRKRKKILILALIIPIFILTVGILSVVVLGKVYTATYEKTKTAQSLYNLCNYYSYSDNNEKIIELYPKLLFSGQYNFSEIQKIDEENIEDIHDYLIFVYMKACGNIYDGGVFAQKAADAFIYYSSFDLAFYYTGQVIDEYYDRTKDSESVIDFYELTLEKEDDIEYKYTIYDKEYNFVLWTLDDPVTAKRYMLPKLNQLWADYEKYLNGEAS